MASRVAQPVRSLDRAARRRTIRGQSWTGIESRSRFRRARESRPIWASPSSIICAPTRTTFHSSRSATSLTSAGPPSVSISTGRSERTTSCRPKVSRGSITRSFARPGATVRPATTGIRKSRTMSSRRWPRRLSWRYRASTMPRTTVT